METDQNPTSRRDDVRAPVHWSERVRVILFLLVYVVLIESAYPTPFIQSPFGKVTYFLIVFYVLKEIVRYRQERSPRFYRKVQRWNAKLTKRKFSVTDYTRYRIYRLFRFAFMFYAIGWLIDSATTRCTGAFACATAIPTMAVQNLAELINFAVRLAMSMFSLFGIMYLLARMDLHTTILPDSIKTRFSDVYGQDKAVERLKESRTLLDNPELIESRGGYQPGGILITGPPGTGKSYLAEAMAGEVGKPFVSVGAESFASMWVGVPIMKVKMLFKHLRKLSVKHGGVICVAPETLVLTDDLCWIRADELREGQGIFGVDEYGKREDGGRRTRHGVIERVAINRDRRYRITTEHGSVVVNAEHPFLMRQYPPTESSNGSSLWGSIAGRPGKGVHKFKMCDRLEVGSFIKFLASPWESESGDTWLAGMYDGEGNLSYGGGVGRGFNVSINQNVNGLDQRIESELMKRDVEFSAYMTPGGEKYTIDHRQFTTTRFHESLRLLGMVRPQRLLDRYMSIFEGDDTPRLGHDSWSEVLSIEEVDEGEVVTIQTSIRTFIANGFVTHNCFFDEIDIIGSRGGSVLSQFVNKWTAKAMGVNEVVITGGGAAGSGALQMLLTEMSGLAKPKGLYNKIRVVLGFKPVPPPKYRIVWIAATNLPEALDPALLRPGRFDRKIRMTYPDTEGRAETFRGYLNKIEHDVTEEQIDLLARQNPQATGASIKDAVNEALLTAVRENREYVTFEDVRGAILWKSMGEEDGQMEIEEDRRRVALHEGAHAVASHYFRPNDPITFASVVKRDKGTGGFVQALPLHERFTLKSKLEADIMVSLASVWAENYFFDGDVSVGPSSDLKKATHTAYMIETQLGMGTSFVVYDNTPIAELPEDVRKNIQVRLDALYGRVGAFLEERIDQVEAVADLLTEGLTIEGDEIHDLLRRMENESV